jgi:transcriptional regulator with XRE-family HTH domain
MNTTLARERANLLGLSYRVIAEDLGVGKTAVTRWLTGENEIPSRYVIPLADLLGVTADRLLRNEHQHQGAA